MPSFFFLFENQEFLKRQMFLNPGVGISILRGGEMTILTEDKTNIILGLQVTFKVIC